MAMLQAPSFHHLHLNSRDPEAAIDFYTRQFASTSKTSWGGMLALQSPNNVLLLFSQVPSAPLVAPETAIWHFGWHVTAIRTTLATYRSRPDVKLLPLYTGDGGTVDISSDTWPGAGGILGLTKAQIADAKANRIKPKGGGGFAYIEGPDGAIVEYQGDRPIERFNHIHMWQDEPYRAQFWYRKHLNAQPVAGRGPAYLAEANRVVARGPDRSFPALDPDGTYRTPRAAVAFGDVMLTWYARQGATPLAPSRGHVCDHIGLGVGDLDAWVAKLRAEGVRFLEEPYRLGDTHAVMIEGPSREALELVEVK